MTGLLLVLLSRPVLADIAPPGPVLRGTVEDDLPPPSPPPLPVPWLLPAVGAVALCSGAALVWSRRRQRGGTQPGPPP